MAVKKRRTPVLRVDADEICGFESTGWVYGTGVYNSTIGGGTRYNGPLTMQDQTGVFLDQLYVFVSVP